MNFVAICSSCLLGRPAATAFCMFSIVEAVMYEHVVGIRIVNQERLLKQMGTAVFELIKPSLSPLAAANRHCGGSPTMTWDFGGSSQFVSQPARRPKVYQHYGTVEKQFKQYSTT